MIRASFKIFLVLLLIALSTSKLQEHKSSSYLLAYSPTWQGLLQYNEDSDYQILSAPQASVVYEVTDSEDLSDVAQIISQTCTGLANGNFYCMTNSGSPSGNLVIINQMDYKKNSIISTYVGNISFSSFQAFGTSIIINPSNQDLSNFMVYDAQSNSNVCNMANGDTLFPTGIYNNGYVILTPAMCSDSGTCIFYNYTCSTQTLNNIQLNYNSTLFNDGFYGQTILLGSGSSAVAVVFTMATQLNGVNYSPNVGMGAYIITSSGSSYDPTIGFYYRVVQVSQSNIIVVNQDSVLTQYEFNFATNTFSMTSLPTLTIPLVINMAMNQFNTTATMLVESYNLGYSNYYINTQTMTIISSQYEGTIYQFANGSYVDLNNIWQGNYMIQTGNSFYTYTSPPNFYLQQYSFESITNAYYGIQYDDSNSSGCSLIAFLWSQNTIVNTSIPQCTYTYSTYLMAVSSFNNVWYLILNDQSSLYLYNSSSGLMGQVPFTNGNSWPNLYIDAQNNHIWWYDITDTYVYYLNNFTLLNSSNFSSNFAYIYKPSPTLAIGINLNKATTAVTFSVFNAFTMTISQNFTVNYTGTLYPENFYPEPMIWDSQMENIKILNNLDT